MFRQLILKFRDFIWNQPEKSLIWRAVSLFLDILLFMFILIRRLTKGGNDYEDELREIDEVRMIKNPKTKGRVYLGLDWVTDLIWTKLKVIWFFIKSSVKMK